MLQIRTIFTILMVCNVTLCKKQDNPLKNYLTVPSTKIELMNIDKELIRNLNLYADKLQKRVDLLQRISDEISQPLNEAKGREEEYVANPLNSFPLVRHMHSDWQLLEELMTNQVGQEQIDYLKKKLAKLPLAKDVKEATEAIYRIERTYEAQPEDMAHGLVDGVQYNANLSALDCYVIGAHHYRLESYEKAIEWLIVATQLLSSSDTRIYNVLGLSHDDINLLLARCHLEMGNTELAEDVLNNDKDKINNLQLARLHNVDKSPDDNAYLVEILPEEFTMLCRSSYKPKPSRLQCRYNTTTTPFLQLAPFRMEQLSLNPYIVAYHNVLSDKEITQLVQFTAPKFEKALIFDDAMEKVEKLRTVDGVFFPSHKITLSVEISNLVDRITQRAFDLTGFKLNSQDRFQILRYGFGGHYSPHYDYFNNTSWFAVKLGDRIATLLFYLNDVTHGGDTVFPDIKLKVQAEKGKVLFWYNLDGESLDCDQETWHGACPVIDGIKLAMASWIHEWNQMFIKPSYRRPVNRVDWETVNME